MKKLLTLFSILFLLLSLQSTFAVTEDTEVYAEKNKFGLMKGGEKITDAIYLKLIRLGDDSYLFMHKNKYGIIDKDGKILVEPKYTQAQRYLSRFVKLGSKGLWTLYNQKGEVIIPQEYSSIDILYGKMFLVKKHYKYGLIGFDGNIILKPVADDIYMPKPNILKISYEGKWYEIEQKRREAIEIPSTIAEIRENSNFTITEIIDSPITSAGYGIVSASDYFIKIFSSISPAYEQTIDELILDHGADTVVILFNPLWIAKFPFVYCKNYAKNFKTPDNGPLSDTKSNLKSKIKKN